MRNKDLQFGLRPILETIQQQLLLSNCLLFFEWQNEGKRVGEDGQFKKWTHRSKEVGNLVRIFSAPYLLSLVHARERHSRDLHCGR